MDVEEAIQVANALLPGDPVEDGRDPRWQAIIAVGDYIETEPEAVWRFICQWGSHQQEDLRSAIATCLLEHLLEYHFISYFSQIEQLALANPLFGDTFQRCWHWAKPRNQETRNALWRFNGGLKSLSRHKSPHQR